MNSMKDLDVKAALTLPLGTALLLSFYDNGQRTAVAQLITKRDGTLTLHVWRSSTGRSGTKPEIWTLKASGGFLTDVRKGFRCSLRVPTHKELVTIQEQIKRYPPASVPLDGQCVFLRYPGVAEPDITEAVGIVTAQRLECMEVDLSYFSPRQGKRIIDPIVLDRVGDGWLDRSVGIACLVAVIDRARFDAWLEQDEKLHRPIGGPKNPGASVAKPAPLSEESK
jgi:hypothetical protein